MLRSKIVSLNFGGFDPAVRLILVEGLRALEQHGLKSGDDQLVQRLTIVWRQVRKLARSLPLLDRGGDRGAQFVISRAGHLPMRSP